MFNIMKTPLVVIFFVMVFLIHSQPAFAQQQTPHKVIKNLGNSLVKRLSEGQINLSSQPELVGEIIQQELMPHLDYRYAAYKILGKYVKTVSKKEREEFASVMKDYLTVIHIDALSQFKNQKITFGDRKSVV